MEYRLVWRRGGADLDLQLRWLFLPNFPPQNRPSSPSSWTFGWVWSRFLPEVKRESNMRNEHFIFSLRSGSQQPAGSSSPSHKQEVKKMNELLREWRHICLCWSVSFSEITATRLVLDFYKEAKMKFLLLELHSWPEQKMKMTFV